MYDLIIIGGGPAGITAGIYAARQKLKTILIAKDFGGQMAKKSVPIENYPGFLEISGKELIEKFVSHLKKQKIEILEDEVVKVEKRKGVFFIFTKGKKIFQSLAAIVASGADPRKLKVPGEEKFLGRGLSYCSACDAPLFKNKTVAVVGGGDAGFESAIFLANYAKKIYVLEYSKEVKASPENQARLEKTRKAEIMTNAALKRIEGKDFVEKIFYQDKEGKENELSVDGVFVEIGSQPATVFVRDLVDFNERGEIKVDFETFKTKTPGLFAVGDVNVGKVKQIITACGEGAKAALSAYQYIRETKR